MSASAVSRRLRAHGLRALPSGTPAGRHGVRVREALRGVTINVDLPTAGRSERTARDIAEVLTEDGYAVEPNPHDPTILYVTRSA